MPFFQDKKAEERLAKANQDMMEVMERQARRHQEAMERLVRNIPTSDPVCNIS